MLTDIFKQVRRSLILKFVFFILVILVLRSVFYLRFDGLRNKPNFSSAVMNILFGANSSYAAQNTSTAAPSNATRSSNPYYHHVSQQGTSIHTSSSKFYRSTSETKTFLKGFSLANMTTTSTTTVNSTSTFSLRTTTPNMLSRQKDNVKCLHYLLQNNVVEYYYHPKDDDDNLNFSTKGIRSNKRLDNEYTQPNMVFLSKPSINYNESLIPKNICSSVVLDFLPNMRAEDHDMVRYLLKFFRHVAKLAGMEYYLSFGSILGHVRFNGRPLPWDDDIDIIVEYAFIKKFKRIFQRERKRYCIEQNLTFCPGLYVGSDRMKIFNTKHKKISQYVWTFPFIDLFFYSIPNEDFYDLPDEKIASFVLNDAFHSAYSINISLSVMLPLKMENFLGVQMFVPVNSSNYLSMIKYDEAICKPLKWMHRYEATRTDKYPDGIECSLLSGFYNFTNGI